MNHTYFLRKITVFHGRVTPEPGILVGYGAIIEALKLRVRFPQTLTIISSSNRRYEKDEWRVFSPKYQPERNIYKQLVFALKYEGIDLLVFKFLFLKLKRSDVIDILKIEPTGEYTRRIWFLYEWLMKEELDIPDLTFKNYVPLLNEKLQFSIQGTRSSRHRIVNNLPGTQEFCPLIFKTPKLNDFIEQDLSSKKDNYLQTIRKDILQRASAFLLLKDSRASFTIEGEDPKNNRAVRWGKAIGQAGMKPLNKDELIRLQQIIIESRRFTKMGLRTQGGFVGGHDRETGGPIPEHISARWQDLERLIDGLLVTNDMLEADEFDAVLTATMVAFGFVFIHPFVDGNGRIHRYLIHHILARKKFADQGIVFPVSAAILNRIDEYRQVLESFSHPLLDLIEWRTTPDNNVEVLNETIDYYRYFDVTRQAEFLYACVEDTIKYFIPDEVKFLLHYDEMKRYLDDFFEMPDKMVALLVRSLEMNNGRLIKRMRKKEFQALKEQEVRDIENKYKEIFLEGV
jgi:hypothetical protein